MTYSYFLTASWTKKKSFKTLAKVERFDPVQRPVVAELLRDDRFLG